MSSLYIPGFIYKILQQSQNTTSTTESATEALIKNPQIWDFISV